MRRFAGWRLACCWRRAEAAKTARRQPHPARHPEPTPSRRPDLRPRGLSSPPSQCCRTSRQPNWSTSPPTRLPASFRAAGLPNDTGPAPERPTGRRARHSLRPAVPNRAAPAPTSRLARPRLPDGAAAVRHEPAPSAAISASTWDPVTLTWHPIARSENYLVQIRHPGGVMVHSAIVPGGVRGAGRYLHPGERVRVGSVGGGREWRPRLLLHQRRDYRSRSWFPGGASGMGSMDRHLPVLLSIAAHRAQGGTTNFSNASAAQGSAGLKKCSKMAQAYARISRTAPCAAAKVHQVVRIPDYPGVHGEAGKHARHLARNAGLVPPDRA